MRRFGEAREDGRLQRRPAASAVFSIQLLEGRSGTVPVDTISGRFYDLGEAQVGDVFERDGVAGASGGRRASL